MVVVVRDEEKGSSSTLFMQDEALFFLHSFLVIEEYGDLFYSASLKAQKRSYCHFPEYNSLQNLANHVLNDRHDISYDRISNG